MKFRTPYDRSTHLRQVVEFHEPSRTKQAHAAECDINQIVKRAKAAGGLLPDMIRQGAQYGDFSSGVDFREALERVQLAEEQFSALSAEVRKEFGNDPGAFLDFATDPRNMDRMVKMGLAQAVNDPDSGALGEASPSPASPPAKKGVKPPPSASAEKDDA